MSDITEDQEANIFLISWDIHGMEALVPVSKKEKEMLFNVLQTGSSGEYHKWLGQTVNMLLMRARYNPQRHYEVYVIHATESVTENDIRTLFEENPQAGADLIRARGSKIFGERMNADAIKIR